MAKTYATREGARLTALKQASLVIEPGEFVSVVGASGCGKSTLMKIVAGLLAPSAGSARVSGEPVTGPRRDVGIVFQQPLLLPWIKVLGNVLIPVVVQRRRRSAYRERALSLLDMVGLAGFERRYPRELSGGMQQRVSIARALVHDPSVLLMDEPFGALDAMTREHMGLDLQRIWQATRKTILFVTHSIPEAVFVSDRVAVMTPRPGRIAALVDVDLPRPRELSVLGTEQFAALTTEVRERFDSVAEGVHSPLNEAALRALTDSVDPRPSNSPFLRNRASR